MPTRGIWGVLWANPTWPGAHTSFVLPLTLHEPDGVYGYFIDFRYDSTVLRLDGAWPGALPWGQGWPGPSLNAEPGRLRAAESGSLALEETGPLIGLAFTVRDGVAWNTEIPVRFAAEVNDGALLAATTTGRVRVIDPLTVWLDFDAAPGGDGSRDAPAVSLAEALAALSPGHTLRLMPGASPEGGRIETPARLEAWDGPVRIGAGG